MDIVIREIESKDYISVSAIWRDVLGFSSVELESHREETYIDDIISPHSYGQFCFVVPLSW